MKIAIMQPYFFPYLGYFQLINAVDHFIIYDNIKYVKGGWINRNRLMNNGSISYFTVPIKKASDSLNISQREVAYGREYDRFKNKFQSRLIEAYRNANNYEKVFSIVEECLSYKSQNLFDFIHFSTKQVLNTLNIKTKITISSKLDINQDLKSQNRIIAICNHFKCSDYYNVSAGSYLYDKDFFKSNGIDLNFVKMDKVYYKRGHEPFVKDLSIIDFLMYHNQDVRNILQKYFII